MKKFINSLPKFRRVRRVRQSRKNSSMKSAFGLNDNSLNTYSLPSGYV
jgi:hypothetical protein